MCFGRQLVVTERTAHAPSLATGRLPQQSWASSALGSLEAKDAATLRKERETRWELLVELVGSLRSRCSLRSWLPQPLAKGTTLRNRGSSTRALAGPSLRPRAGGS